MIAQLEDIRTSQELYRDITGGFAPDFATLAKTLKTDSIPFRQVLEDPRFPGDPDKFIINTIYSSALDSMNAMGIDLDGLGVVPYSDNARFSIMADTITYQLTNVWVTEVMAKYSDFMGSYSSRNYMKYDDTYNPDNLIGFGSMNSPILSGNWR